MWTPVFPAAARRAGLAAALAASLGACSPGAPEGVDKQVLDNAISQRIGDPNTCVLIGKAGSGEVVYRYNTHVACGRQLPTCEGGSAVSADDMLEAVAKGGPEIAVSCPTVADRSRSVGWAAGRVPGRDLVYAAVMEGDKALPGRVMADRIERAFVEAGVQPAR
ncbi:MAG: hypothetical protein ACK4YQ_07435 [Phenylobacterium sp.]|uniref:hypothetical protein n=1 Tax=Phenylobacterium sp. TaxID=1871053 RepID=UPI00391D3364